MIHKLLDTDYNPDTFCDVCPLQIKKYFDFKDKEVIFNEFIPQLNYGTRGLYFVPLKASYSKILYLFKEGDLQIKEVKKDTLNFMIQKTLKRDVYDLYLQGPNNIVKQGIACVPNLKCSLMVRGLFEELDVHTDLRVECKFNEKFGKWEPLQKTMDPMSKVDDI